MIFVKAAHRTTFTKIIRLNQDEKGRS